MGGCDHFPQRTGKRSGSPGCGSRLRRRVRADVHAPGPLRSARFARGKSALGFPIPVAPLGGAAWSRARSRRCCDRPGAARSLLPAFSTGVFSGRKPCLSSWSIISSSSAWISETMLQGMRPSRAQVSPR